MLQSMKEDKRNSQDGIQPQALKNTNNECFITPGARRPEKWVPAGRTRCTPFGPLLRSERLLEYFLC